MGLTILKIRNCKRIERLPVSVLLVTGIGFAITGCASTAWSEKVSFDAAPQPTECAGWQRINMGPKAAMVLVREDAKLVAEIDAHNLRGRNLGCWK